MSDLISRSQLLKKFNDTGIQITFDLPVEEILGDDVDIDDFTMLVQDAIQAYKNMVIGTIKEQPTAYNVDKVLIELDEQTNLHNISEASDYWTWITAMEKAIDIVKRGGVE